VVATIAESRRGIVTEQTLTRASLTSNVYGENSDVVGHRAPEAATAGAAYHALQIADAIIPTVNSGFFVTVQSVCATVHNNDPSLRGGD